MRPVNFDRLLQRAGLAFRAAGGGSATLSGPVVLKEGRRSLVARCRVASGPPGISAVIVKRIKEEAVRGFSDWAGLAFLSGLPAARGLVPRFGGGDVPERLFLMEDLGEGRRLQDILQGTDPDASRAALRALAVSMARLHSATLGREGEFESGRAVLPETEGLGRHAEASRWLEGREKWRAWFAALDCAAPPGFEDGLQRVAEVYREPDGFLAFTHGDPAPSNNHFSPAGARLVDFEYGGFRHALYDITAWNVLCPLPARCVEEMRRDFRAELAKACPAARDEAGFGEAWAVLCAYRALAMLTWIPPDIVHGNRPWADAWTMREAVFVAVSRLEEVAAPWAPLAAIGEAAGAWARAMRARWPECRTVEGASPRWPGLDGGVS